MNAETLSAGLLALEPSPAFAAAWVGFWVLASVLYRLRQGKPLLPRRPRPAEFGESWVSGRSMRNAWTRFGGARNCLQVALTHEALIVRPCFPVNLIFMPELLDLEHCIARSSILGVRRVDSWLSGAEVEITFQDTDGRERQLRLFRRQADALLKTLQKA
jgi:hypothetical protein